MEKENIQEMVDKYTNNKHACTCPVCHGVGTVPAGFYLSDGQTFTSGGGRDTCKSCNGQGYVVI